MDSIRPENESDLRNAKRIGIVFISYAIILPFIILLLPESELPASAGPSLISWLMVLLMPIEILLIYGFYRHFGNKSDLNNIMGPAILMYTLSTIPSIYSLIIGFTDPVLLYLAIPLGLTFSLVGFWLASMFVSNLWDMIRSSEQ